MMELHLIIVGILLIVLALIHLLIPKYFNWPAELSSLSLGSRQIMYVHTFFVAFMVLLMGILCLCAPQELSETVLGRILVLGLFIFWFTRLIFQFFVYSPQLWKGKKFETAIHIIFSMLWLYISGVFLATFLFSIARGIK
jgi:hypothetical protein